MSNPVLRFIYDRRKKASKSAEGKVEIEIYYKRQRKWISTGVSVFPSQWDEARGVVKRPDAPMLNRHLQKIKTPIELLIANIIRRGEEFSFERLRENRLTKTSSHSLLDYIEEKICARGDIRESTRLSQFRIIGALRRWGKMKYLKDVSKQNILHFDSWLHEKYTKQQTIYTFHKILKTYLNYAVKEDLIDKNPYTGVTIDRGVRQSIRYLTPKELEKVNEMFIPTGATSRARDLFLFQCYTGLAYADLSGFDFSDVEERDGKFIVRGRRQKTGIEFYIILLPPAMKILRKYNFRLPLVSNQKYNKALTEVGKKAGLKFKLTSHCGRHTFGTWVLNQGIPIEVLKTMMGHADSRTTKIYAKVLNESVESAFEILEKNMTTSNSSRARYDDNNIININKQYSI